MFVCPGPLSARVFSWLQPMLPGLPVLCTLQMPELWLKVQSECKHQEEFCPVSIIFPTRIITFVSPLPQSDLSFSALSQSRLCAVSLCALPIVQKCCSSDYVPSTVIFSSADASSGRVSSNHISALIMMFNLKFTQTRILRTLRQYCSPLRQNYLISITILISFPTVTLSVEYKFTRFNFPG